MRRLRVLLWPAAVVLGAAAESASFGWGDPGRWVPDLLTGWTLIACGLVVWSRRGDSRSGPLLVATGYAWFLGNFADVGLAPVAWLGAHAVYLYRGPLVHLLVTYPSGRLSSRLEVGAAVTGYVAAVLTPVWKNEVATLVLAAGLVAVCARSFSTATGAVRRQRLIALWAASAVGLVAAAGAAARLGLPDGDVSEPSLLALEATLCAVAVALAAGLLSHPGDRGAVTDLVIELGQKRAATLRDELARALGDPTLEVGYWLPDRAEFVDSDDRPLAVPGPAAGRSVTLVESSGGPVAALVHDPAVLDDPHLREAVATAARLAAANARLTAEVRIQVDDLAVSRRRILEAADDERRRLERRLHEGARARLERLSEQLRGQRPGTRSDAAREALALAEDQLRATIDELDRLARGLHPRVLTDLGLAGAIASLVEQAPVTVDLVAPVPVLAEDAEAVAFFVCSEALANVAKHAHASRVTVSVTSLNGRVDIEIADDGSGGADAAAGTGLRGLADRVEAAGGTLRIDSPAGRGTRLVATLNGSSSTA